MATGSTRTLERRQPVLTDFQLQLSRHISLKRSTLVDYFLIFCNFNYVSIFWGRMAWETKLLLQLRNGTVTRRSQRDMFRYVQIFRYLSLLRYLPCLSLWCLSDTYWYSTERNLNALSVALQLVMPLFTADFQNFAPDWLRRHQQLELRNFSFTSKHQCWLRLKVLQRRMRIRFASSVCLILNRPQTRIVSQNLCEWH